MYLLLFLFVLDVPAAGERIILFKRVNIAFTLMEWADPPSPMDAHVDPCLMNLKTHIKAITSGSCKRLYCCNYFSYKFYYIAFYYVIFPYCRCWILKWKHRLNMFSSTFSAFHDIIYCSERWWEPVTDTEPRLLTEGHTQAGPSLGDEQAGLSAFATDPQSMTTDLPKAGPKWKGELLQKPIKRQIVNNI